VTTLLSELSVMMESSNNLHCALVQDAVELLMTFIIPMHAEDKQLESHKDLLDGVALPEWLVPIVNVSFFLHYFRGELSSLPLDCVELKTSPASLD